MISIHKVALRKGQSLDSVIKSEELPVFHFRPLTLVSRRQQLCFQLRKHAIGNTNDNIIKMAKILTKVLATKKLVSRKRLGEVSIQMKMDART